VSAKAAPGGNTPPLKNTQHDKKFKGLLMQET
jgi:hypothetical protein